MDWLKRIFEFGRLKSEPKGHTAGRAIAPASVKRTQLGIKEVDLPRGVVVLKDGSARGFLEVTGYPVHHRSAEDARAWLRGYASVLNTLPGNAVLLARSQAGGLEKHVKAQSTALAAQAQGSALAKLAQDQLAHAEKLQATGQVRKTRQFVALHSPRGDTAKLLAKAEECRRHLEVSGVRSRLVVERDLAEALARDWDPFVEEPAWIDMEIETPDRQGVEPVGMIDYRPKTAKVMDKRPEPKATVSEVR